MSPITRAGVIPASSAAISPESAAAANISLPSSKRRITAEDGLSPPVKTMPNKKISLKLHLTTKNTINKKHWLKFIRIFSGQANKMK
jgi:hypothetical protein